MHIQCRIVRRNDQRTPKGQNIFLIEPRIRVKVNSVSDTFVAVLFNEAQKHRLRDAVGHGVLCSQNAFFILCELVE
ncbi:hypothetical protein SDC9_164962 [bioreactor metagenome]|uniref:Uncharacterized protein n=1 Tax=bioreactor metagenome TaxID=1076179 RepID=A0A645FT20_9ZZZZ